MMSFVSPAGVSVAAFLGAGLILGLFYFAALWRTVTLLAGGSPWLGPVAFTLGRIAGALLFFGVAVRFGAPNLLAAFAGVLIARLIAMRVVRKAA